LSVVQADDGKDAALNSFKGANCDPLI